LRVETDSQRDILIGPGGVRSGFAAWGAIMTGTNVIGTEEAARRVSEALPAWRFDGKTLRRIYKVNGFRSALVVTTTIGHLAEAAWHHPDIALSWGKVEVVLWSHDAGGVTERDFALAQQIEAVIAWRPAAGGPLEGTPAEPAHAYVLAD
jgi:4a-hydroxytetrahydrobiopterin dehydratase